MERSALLALLDEQKGYRGNERARRVVHFADAAAESPGESWTRWAIVEAGLPAPQLQVEFHDSRTGRLVARVSHQWREAGYALA